MVRFKKPIIAISMDFIVHNDENNRYAILPWNALRLDYADAVIAQGGIPFLIPSNENAIDDILDIIDGLIIPGGADIDPKFYGQDPISDTLVFNNDRTNYDIKLLKKALAQNMPIMGICYGMQLMNIIQGGTLIQDIPTSKYKSDINHQPPIEERQEDSHLIHIIEDTKLHKMTSNTVSMVNSNHHQAIDKLGFGVKVSAKAEDGIIEAIELDGYDFVFGVEWHPEFQRNELDCNIFKAFMDIAQRHRLL